MIKLFMEHQEHSEDEEIVFQEGATVEQPQLRRDDPLANIQRMDLAFYSRESFFSEKDRGEIRAGLFKLADLLNSREKLPDTLLMPETSTRPLFYAADPVIEEMYHRKGQPKPVVQFIKTPESKYPQALQQIEAGEELVECEGSYYPSFVRHQFELQGRIVNPVTRKDLEKVITEQTAEFAKRMDEIKASDAKNILVIDDYATDELNTFKTIQRELGDIPVEFFAFKSSLDKEHTPGNVAVGVYEELSPGFAYKDNKFEFKHKSIGVEKQHLSPYVSKTQNANPDLMKWLRDNMRAVGNDVRQELL